MAIFSKRSRTFASGHKKANATNYRRFHGIQKKNDAKPLNRRDFSKHSVEGLEMSRLVQKIQIFCERMHEEFVKGAIHSSFRRCSKDLVTDLVNENISEIIEPSGKRLALRCTLHWIAKCVLRCKFFLACRSSVWQMKQELVVTVQADQEQKAR